MSGSVRVGGTYGGDVALVVYGAGAAAMTVLRPAEALKLAQVLIQAALDGREWRERPAAVSEAPKEEVSRWEVIEVGE